MFMSAARVIITSAGNGPTRPQNRRAENVRGTIELAPTPRASWTFDIPLPWKNGVMAIPRSRSFRPNISVKFNRLGRRGTTQDEAFGRPVVVPEVYMSALGRLGDLGNLDRASVGAPPPRVSRSLGARRSVLAQHHHLLQGVHLVLQLEGPFDPVLIADELPWCWSARARRHTRRRSRGVAPTVDIPAAAPARLHSIHSGRCCIKTESRFPGWGPSTSWKDQARRKDRSASSP